MGTLGAVRFFAGCCSTLFAPAPATLLPPAQVLGRTHPCRVDRPPSPRRAMRIPLPPFHHASWVHFLSVYFFSVYTRPTSVEHGRAHALPIFGGGNAIHSLQFGKKPWPGGAYLQLGVPPPLAGHLPPPGGGRSGPDLHYPPPEKKGAPVFPIATGPDAYGHTTGNTPEPVRFQKLSLVRPS